MNSTSSCSRRNFTRPGSPGVATRLLALFATGCCLDGRLPAAVEGKLDFQGARIREEYGEALDALSRQTAVPVPRLEDWRQQALVGVEQALQIRVHDDPTQLRLDEANRRIGELSMEVELLRARCEKSGPFAGRRSRP